MDTIITGDCREVMAGMISSYHRLYPESLFLGGDGRIYGIWIEGNCYKRKAGFYGEYPPSYLKRIYALFAPVLREVKSDVRILHLFSGSVREPLGITVDVNAALEPDILCSAEEIWPALEATRYRYPLILADPPYSKDDAAKYGTAFPLARKVMRSLAMCERAITPGAFLVWLDVKRPMYRKDEWELVGIIGYDVGTNRRFREISIFRRREQAERENYPLLKEEIIDDNL